MHGVSCMVIVGAPPPRHCGRIGNTSLSPCDNPKCLRTLVLIPWGPWPPSAVSGKIGGGLILSPHISQMRTWRPGEVVYVTAQRQGAFHEFNTRSHRGNERALRWQVWFLPTKYTATPGAARIWLARGWCWAAEAALRGPSHPCPGQLPTAGLHSTQRY